MTSLKLRIVFLALTCLLCGCRKDSESFKCVSEPLFDFKNECKSLPHFRPRFRIYPHSYVGDQLETPTYSALNSDKIALVKAPGKLVIYNRVTNEIEYESPNMGFVTGKPDWGSNNVICFSNLQAQLVHFLDVETFEIKSVNIGAVLEVEWLNESEIIFFQNEGNYGWHFMKYNYYSEKVDTLIANTRDLISGSESYNRKYGKMLFREHLDFQYYNFLTDTYHEGPYQNQEDDLKFLVWHPNKPRVYYIQDDGLYHYDYSDQKETRVKKNCDSWHYSSFDFSPDGEQIIAELHQKWVDKAPAGHQYDEINGRWYYSNTHIVTFDLDGCNEEMVIEGEAR